MEAFKVENLSFIYPDRTNKILDNINITIRQGEFVTLCGKSGCGKTTLLRLLKTAISPYGKVEGNIYFNGKLLCDCDVKEQACSIGFVMQSPDNQIVTDKVWHELAFGLESLGFSTQQIRARVAEMASFFGISDWFYKKVSELSGGQKQLLNLASVMVMQPSVLILDEPASQLDPIAAQEFFGVIEKINRELGTTVILSEHRLEDVFPISDRIIIMDEGRIVAEGTPYKIGEILKSINHEMYQALPVPVRVYGKIVNDCNYPITVRDGRAWLLEYSEKNTIRPDMIPDTKPFYEVENAVVEVRDAWFRYEKNMSDVIKGLNVKVGKGELFALLGDNGSGKTTALSLISGINKPYRGQIFINGKNIFKIDNLYTSLLGVLPQNPQSIFSKKTVYLDLEEMISAQGLSDEEKADRIYDIAILCRIENLLNNHPYDLSGGEQQRAALAKVLLKNPQILLLDEPTKGMDAQFKEEFADILYELKNKGVTIIMVSHDIEFCCEYADRCALVFDGNITSQGTPREFFAGKNFYTTAANRMSRTVLEKAVTANDIIMACGGEVYKKERKKRVIDKTELKKQSEAAEYQSKQEEIKVKTKEKAFNIQTITALIVVLLIIPLTIFAGMRFFGNRKYYLTSLLIIIEAMLPFGLLFERRKPQAREIVLISVLCAIAVAGRTAFFMLPQFKPVMALIIIAAVCFGGETGFLVGAVTAFVSNFFFGQGPWTPWQMFGFGIVGLLAGVVYDKWGLKKTRLSLCTFGFFATFIIYGGIMNPASIIMVQEKITKEMILLAYVSGMPLDFVLAVSTVVFMWFISGPMIDKLDRVKIKYGFIKRQ